MNGTVVLADETPVEKALVQLSPGGYADTTDVSGQFSLTGVPTGEYCMSVSMLSIKFEDMNIPITVPLRKQNPLIVVMQRRTYRIDEIVVLSDHGDRIKETENLPSFVTVVERSEFENNASTVADVITATPSANISVMGGLGDYTEVSLRGSYSNQVHVYVDGMLLNEAIGGAVNLGTIPLTLVESVEVWRSGAPAQFGGDGVGGVVNIKTRNTHTMQKMFSLGYGSFDTFTANTVVNIPFGMSRIHVTADHASSRNDFRYMSDNGTDKNKEDDYWARRHNDEFRSTNLLSKYTHLFGNGMFLELSEHILSNNKNIPNRQHIQYSHASLKTAKNLFQAQLTLHPFLRNVVKVTPSFHHTYSHEHYMDMQGSIGWGKQDNIYNTNTFNFMIPLSIFVKNYADFTITSTATHESYRPENKLEKTIPLSCDREHVALIGDALFKTPGERFTVTSNVRRDRYFSSYDGQANPMVPVPVKPEFHYSTNSQIGLKVRALKNISFQCNYGDMWRIPSFYELFGDRGGTVGKPFLRPEHVYRWDAGVKLGLRKPGLPFNGTLECAYFKNHYRDLIQWYTITYGFMQAENVGNSYVKGIEFVWNMNLIKHLTCSGNWTFQRSKVTEEMRIYYVGKKLPNRPESYGSAKWEIPLSHIALFWIIDRKGSYYLDRVNQKNKLFPGRTLLDFGFTVSLMQGKTACTVLAKNIINVHTFDIQGMPKPGISFNVTFKYTMN
ncbi:MAG TPA: TonB-dependent receptor [Anaerolineae bacterium]|nr:TonB-dependent receptor [Anaerolineae bacterium]